MNGMAEARRYFSIKAKCEAAQNVRLAINEAIQSLETTPVIRVKTAVAQGVLLRCLDIKGKSIGAGVWEIRKDYGSSEGRRRG